MVSNYQKLRTNTDDKVKEFEVVLGVREPICYDSISQWQSCKNLVDYTQVTNL